MSIIVEWNKDRKRASGRHGDLSTRRLIRHTSLLVAFTLRAYGTLYRAPSDDSLKNQ